MCKASARFTINIYYSMHNVEVLMTKSSETLSRVKRKTRHYFIAGIFAGCASWQGIFGVPIQ